MWNELLLNRYELASGTTVEYRVGVIQTVGYGIFLYNLEGYIYQYGYLADWYAVYRFKHLTNLFVKSFHEKKSTEAVVK